MSRRLLIAWALAAGSVLGYLAPTLASAETPPEAPLPAMRFSADAATTAFFEQIQRAPQFRNLSREALGSPLELRVYHTYRIGRGSATATGLLAAATLGIIPQVMSGEHSIVYEVLVNGVPVSLYRYSRSLTRARSLWVHDTTHGLGAEGVKWAQSTVDLFVKDAAADPKLAALGAEFDYYFPPAKK